MQDHVAVVRDRQRATDLLSVDVGPRIDRLRNGIVGIAALNLVLDFDFIENGVAAGAPKWMEWYAAFGLTVTLVWLYIEILRLLSKMRRN